MCSVAFRHSGGGIEACSIVTELGIENIDGTVGIVVERVSALLTVSLLIAKVLISGLFIPETHISICFEVVNKLQVGTLAPTGACRSEREECKQGA